MSGKGQREKKKGVEERLRVKTVGAHIEISALDSGYNEIQSALNLIANDEEEDPKTIIEAKSLSSKMDKLEYVILTSIWNRILSRFNMHLLNVLLVDIENFLKKGGKRARNINFAQGPPNSNPALDISILSHWTLKHLYLLDTEKRIHGIRNEKLTLYRTSTRLVEEESESIVREKIVGFILALKIRPFPKDT
ncbi:Uncharacterized protein APZ42_012955 [Daphnia magna]|uniref:Uncharacterized protein n=1 Tax=Daphnia magna TaxID=35525 RepID=A0A162RB22_9CRUS|nr:Uncharacterized protein APZ42_012955 [Daphnia magna]